MPGTGQVLPGPAAADAGWMLGDDIRARVRVLVTDLDQNPAPLPGAGQGKAAGELAALQPERQMTRFVAEDLGRALIHDDHRAAAARLSVVQALEVARFQRVVLDWHGQPPLCRIQGRSLGNGPRAQDLADLDPEIEMQPRRVMNLHDKTGGHHPATVPRPQAAEPRPGVAAPSRPLAPGKVLVQCRRPPGWRRTSSVPRF